MQIRTSIIGYAASAASHKPTFRFATRVQRFIQHRRFKVEFQASSKTNSNSPRGVGVNDRSRREQVRGGFFITGVTGAPVFG